MPLRIGARVGSYEILAPLGAGGMGEVYRARDTQLQRDVALKVVSTAAAADPERDARFEREAQLLASLNHPHIATVYGLARADGVQFLAMELVEGETLAAHLARGAMPIAEAIRVAGQIADALQAAHEKGIIHRDLKPANIALTSSGDVKVLDFGLAKALDDTAAIDTSNSPTLTFAATQAGVILGTAAYMAPEQAKGRAADRRSDLWAFGCVLYEMLTGRRTFDGEDASDTMAAVLRAEPDWAALPRDLPPAVERLLRRCLEKDRRARAVDAGAALFVLRECVSLTPAASTVPPPVPGRSWRRLFATAAIALLLAAAAAGATVYALWPASPRVARFVISAGQDGLQTAAPNTRDFAISPDGTRLVYRAVGDPPMLRLRTLDRLESTLLAGTENAIEPFFSSDGRWIAFVSDGQLRRISVQGGRPVSIIPLGSIRGATWLPDDTIIVANAAGTLYRIHASGATAAARVSIAGEATGANLVYRWPQILPDGRHLLASYGIGQGSSPAMIALIDLETGVARNLFPGSSARVASNGFIVFSADGALRAVRFDLRSMTASPDSIPVAERVLTKASGVADFDVAADGSLVYASGGILNSGTATVMSVDRQGSLTPLPGLTPGFYRDVRLSPEGRRLAVATPDDIWTYDFARAAMSRLTTDPAPDRSPLWSRDGLRILFTSNRHVYPEVFSRSADGTGVDQLLFGRSKDAIDLRADSWSPDGTRLLFTEVPPDVICRFGQLDPGKPSDTTPLVHDQFCSDYPAVSPDGHWIAYVSSLSGRVEVYVEHYPALGARQQVSIGGGTMPIWSASGGELFFLAPDAEALFAVPTQLGDTVGIGQAHKIAEGQFLTATTGYRPYDVAEDGRVFVIANMPAKGAQPSQSPDMILIQNWFEELKRLSGRTN